MSEDVGKAFPNRQLQQDSASVDSEINMNYFNLVFLW